MQTTAKINHNIQSYLAMKDLIETYEQMAANVMKQIRDAILASREYYHGLAELSAQVGADISNLKPVKNKRTAVVLLSADEGMYGEITDRVFVSFIRRIKEGQTVDVYISGQIGQELMQMIAPKIKYQPLALTAQSEDSLIAAIGQKLWPYKRVEIFFGQFESVAKQTANSRVLSVHQFDSAKKRQSGEIEKQLKFIYEPSVEQVSNKFSQNIFIGVLRQTIAEDKLAKNASRLMHLDKALGHIDDRLVREQAYYRKAVRRRLSKKQQQQLSGFIAMSNSRRTHGRL